MTNDKSPDTDAVLYYSLGLICEVFSVGYPGILVVYSRSSSAFVPKLKPSATKSGSMNITISTQHQKLS